MTLNQTPQLLLLLNGTSKKERVKSSPMVWNPANILRGNLVITCSASVKINEVTTFLEGGRLGLQELTSQIS
jgi:hypothetical protein